MNIERRLNHAARELREVTIEVPALDDLAGRDRRRDRSRPRLAALAAPMLFVAGGVLAVGVMQRSVDATVHSDFGGVAVEADAGPTATTDLGVPAPSVDDELRLIRSILESAAEPTGRAPAERAPDPPSAVAAGPH